ncbi:hypothetical protein AGMMS49942_16930 [Spirochaetia bacterium]|nr:hypothetical protein AGMMS49942_16930 [Spirochaetia bacterium]
MTIEQTVDVPASHRLTIDVPRDIPAGRTILAFTPAPAGECPPDHTPNAETLAAKAECDAIMRGDIPVKWHRPKSNSREDILASIREAMED